MVLLTGGATAQVQPLSNPNPAENRLPGPDGNPPGLIRVPPDISVTDDQQRDRLAAICKKLGFGNKEDREQYENRFKEDSVKASARLKEEADQLTALLSQRYDTLKKREAELKKSPNAIHSSLAFVLRAEEETLAAQLELHPKAERRIALRTQHVDRLRSREEKVARLFAAGDKRFSKADCLECKAARVAAEIALHREHCSGVSPEKAATLEELAWMSHDIFYQVYALYRAGGPGGESERCCQAGHNVCLAIAELELARGDRKKALAHLEDAACCADMACESVRAAYNVGTITLDQVLKMGAVRVDTKSRLLDLRRIMGSSTPEDKSALESTPGRAPTGSSRP
jgi:hypothetical protein